jgi:pimeloyl-ACP methyl ester carboxylesterase
MRITTSVRRATAAIVAALVLITATVTGINVASAHGGRGPSGPKPTVVLVHGAFADAAGWSEVTERLQERGYTVIAPANPLRGLASDAAYVGSVIDTIPGPVVLVGHSYGGAVITNAATGRDNVEALVYIAAFAPDAGETIGGLVALAPGSMLTPDALVIRTYPGGADGYVDPARFREIFAGDLGRDEAAVLAATQRPSDVGILDEKSSVPAWSTVPSWYLVATRDNLIPPDAQRMMAERAGSITIEVRSSHVAMMSHPRQAVELIIDAAQATR